MIWTLGFHLVLHVKSQAPIHCGLRIPMVAPVCLDTDLCLISSVVHVQQSTLSIPHLPRLLVLGADGAPLHSSLIASNFLCIHDLICGSSTGPVRPSTKPSTNGKRHSSDPQQSGPDPPSLVTRRCRNFFDISSDICTAPRTPHIPPAPARTVSPAPLP